AEVAEPSAFKSRRRVCRADIEKDDRDSEEDGDDDGCDEGDEGLVFGAGERVDKDRCDDEPGGAMKPHEAGIVVVDEGAEETHGDECHHDARDEVEPREKADLKRAMEKGASVPDRDCAREIRECPMDAPSLRPEENARRHREAEHGGEKCGLASNVHQRLTYQPLMGERNGALAGPLGDLFVKLGDAPI